MKFKYNPLERKLWRIEEDLFYEISEENRFIEHLVYIGTIIKFKLGESHWIMFESGAGLDPTITVYYAKPLKNNELVHYKKQINPGLFQFETTFEFTKEDRIKKEPE